MEMPTREQLVTGDSLDEGWVARHFLGKSREQALELYAGDNFSWTEDLGYMSAYALEYYLEPLDRYLRSEQSQNENDVAMGVLTALTYQIHAAKLSAALRRKIRDLAHYLNANTAKFELDVNDRFYQSLQKNIAERFA